MGEDVRTDLILKLKEIFRSDRSDLDFGIYRILNFKRKEIERFIEEDLVKQAESEFSELVKANFEEQKAELDALREEINRDFGEGTIDSKGEVKRLHDAPKIKRYSELKQAIADQERVKTQINEVFNHVYEFFSRYYDKGDFISQRLFGGREKHVIPHKGEEVSLYWVNQDQYYIKTSEDYRKYSFNLGDYQILFRLVDVESEKDNNVGADSFFVIHRDLPVRFDEENNRLTVFFEHRPLREEDFEFYEIGKTSHQNTEFDTIIEKDYELILDSIVEYPNLTKQIKSSGHSGETSELDHHLIQYYRKNDMDYFIHTRLGDFLRRELDFYIKNEVLDLKETVSKDVRNIKLIQLKIVAIKKISDRIIDFLDQIEKFQKKLFEKKKFVLSTNYCISLDRIPETFYDEIRNNKEQVLEWKKLFRLSETAQGTLFSINDDEPLSIDYLKTHKNLVMDTAFFDDDFKFRLLSSIDDLDDFVEGICIKSENWQALNLLEERYKENINCIYIDPPYNREGDEFLYKDKFKHSSWLSMIDGRVRKALKLMNDTSVIFTSIDDNEIHRFRVLLDQILGESNFITNHVWKKKAGGGSDTKYVAEDHEYVLTYARNKSILPRFFIKMSEKLKSGYNYKDKYFEERGPYKLKNLHQTGIETDRPNLVYPIDAPDGTAIFPPTIWRWSKQRFEKAKSEGRIEFAKSSNGKWQVYAKMYLLKDGEERRVKPRSILHNVGLTRDGNKDIKDLFGQKLFDYPKPVSLLKHLISIVPSEDNRNIIMDFFAGTGTTAHSILLMNDEDSGNRRYILVEMGDYFESILKKRLVKVCFSKKWKDGTPISNEGISHTFKYIYLEQYEDTLNNILFSDKDGLAQTTLQKLPDYFLQHVLDVETKDSPTRLTVDRFKTPFDYKIKTLHGREERTEPVDLVETFNYLLGIKVRKIRQYDNEQTKYIIVYGEKGEDPSCTKVLIIWRNFDETILEKEKQFIEEKILPQFNPHTIYVNVDSLIKGAESIEPKFKELMGA